MQILSGKKIAFSKIRHWMNIETAILIFKSTIKTFIYKNIF